jgi:GNAT superfamily N-acetyltransferase
LPNILIRKFESKDRDAVRRISCETAFQEADRQGFIDDDEVLADALTVYYTDYEPESCFVAVAHDQVIGYIIGTKNVARMERIFSKQILPKLLIKAFKRGFFLKSKTWRLFFNVIKSGLKGEFYAPHFSAEYPAMLHINIDKDYRGRQVGKRLINCYLEFIKYQGIAGVHFGTVSEGAKAFFLKAGLKVLHKSNRSYLKYKTKKIVQFYILGKKF